MISHKDWEYLVKLVENAEKGNQLISSYMFFALGGEVRSEPISKQGGEIKKFPFWPGEKDPCTGIAFSTNVQDWINYLNNQKIQWTFIHSEYPFWYQALIDSSFKYATFLTVSQKLLMKNGFFEAKTLPLAICSAMLRSEHVVKNVCDVGPSLWAPEDSRVLPDDPITMGDR